MMISMDGLSIVEGCELTAGNTLKIGFIEIGYSVQRLRVESRTCQTQMSSSV